MIPNDFKFDVIDRIVLVSSRNKSLIIEEFQKAADFYKKNDAKLIDDMLALQAIAQEKDDYHSDLIASKAEETLKNAGKNEFLFNEDFLFDTYDKIYKQIKSLPTNVLLDNPMIKVLFYDLTMLPQDSGSRISLSGIIINWREYCSRYLEMVN